MVEAFFGFKKTPFSDCPDAKQLFATQAWNHVKARLQFLVDHHGAGLLTGEVGGGKSTAARTFTADSAGCHHRGSIMTKAPAATVLSSTPSKSLNSLIRLCVRGAVVCPMFPLAGCLPSMPSAGGCPKDARRSAKRGCTAIARAGSARVDR